MPTVKGQSAVRHYIDNLPRELEKKLLRGAARAGGKIVLAEAKERSISHEVDEALIMKTRAEDGRIVVTITVAPGWAHAVGTWLEWGTDGHFISVDDSQREGMSVGRINRLSKDGKVGSLAIGGQFVGTTVWHPGARAHPFLRVALDIKEAEAIAAAQSYISSRIARGGIVGGSEPEGDDA